MLVRAARRGSSAYGVTDRRGPARRLAVLLSAALVLAHCGRGASQTSTIAGTLSLSPRAPAVGPATLTVMLRDAADAPLTGATVRLEAHMSHPGMAPVLATGDERAPGTYDLNFSFTMAGDWVLVVHATPPGSDRVERRIQTMNVRVDTGAS